MDTNKFYKIRYRLNEKEFVYRGIYLGREGNLISFNEKIEGKMFLNENNINLINEITDEAELKEIQDKIRRRNDEKNE